MKSEAGRSKKQRKTGGSGGTKNLCGTLSYIAECRGDGQKARSSRLPAPQDDMNRMVRKHPADK